MAEEETPTPAASEAPKASGGGGSKLLPIMLGMNSLLLVAVIAVLFLKTGTAAAAKGGHGEGEKGGEQAEKSEHGDKAKDGKDGKANAPGPTMRLPDFVVHLRDTDSDRYARISFEVELTDEKAKEALTLRVPKIKDAFLAYLSDRSSEELRGSEALGRLKETLAKRLVELAPGVQVRALYLTDLVVQ